MLASSIWQRSAVFVYIFQDVVKYTEELLFPVNRLFR